MMVVYEYANRLVTRGHGVTIVHVPLVRFTTSPLLTRFMQWVRDITKEHCTPVSMLQTSQYEIDSRVRMLYVTQAKASNIPDSDVIFVGSVPIRANIPKEKGKRFRFLMGYRAGLFPPTREDAEWREPVPKIAIARWLYEKGLEMGVPAHEMLYIPVGIDHAKYRLTQPVENRHPCIAMMYHTSPMKGSRYGIEALTMSRERFPSLQAILFGFSQRPTWLPDWIEYRNAISQEELISIYNHSRIYLCPSLSEGFHLPPAEAMACGCALVSTDIGGVHDYAENGVTALLSPPGHPEALADNIIRLLKDDDLRIRLAKAGYERIQEFTWERSTDLLEKALKDKL
jgi:glycosyltransferase involved in cell wall biosynthesis